MSRFLIACTILSCSAAHGAESITLPSHSLSQDKTVSISQNDQNRIVITERDFGNYKTYVELEFNCTDSTVRYLGTSTSPSPNGFDAWLQDKYFSKVTETFVPPSLLSEACKDTTSTLTASQ